MQRTHSNSTSQPQSTYIQPLPQHTTLIGQLRAAPCSHIEPQLSQLSHLGLVSEETITESQLQLEGMHDLINTEDQSPPMTFQEFFNDLDEIMKQQLKQREAVDLRRKLCRFKHICSICQQQIPRSTWQITEESKVYVLKCKHFFHCKCLDSWRDIRNNCPLCRKQLT